MTEYALYLESGPRRRKTMVHVLDLLGCIAQGPTTEEAMEATPEAIYAYLRFLRRHGEAVNPTDVFTTAVAAHVMEGSWIGNGDPVPGFGPDFQPLTSEDLSVYLQRLAWLEVDLSELVRYLPEEQLVAEPEGTGRSILRILQHMAEAQGSYLRATVGKVEGLSEALRAVQQGPEAAPSAMADVWQISNRRLEVMTEEERTQMVRHGQPVWTARRGLRRMLEHGWEHLQEISRRMGRTVG